MKNIFISYKNDGEGNNFAARLCADIEKMGYSVYFNSHERTVGNFPDRLKFYVENCEDFILILSRGCMKQLIDNKSIDWIREEITIAKECNKNIIPVLIGNTDIPQKDTLPDKLNFLTDLEIVSLPEQYLERPISQLIKFFVSKPYKEKRNYIANSNNLYDANRDFEYLLNRASDNDIEAMYEIACMYYYGIPSVDNNAMINYGEASKWLKRISEYGKNNNLISECIVSANIMLANLYYSGNVNREEQSFEKCYDILTNIQKQSEDKYDMFSQDFEKSVFMMTQGMGKKQKFSDIVEYLKSIQMGCSNNIKSSIAKFYMDYGMYQDAIELMETVEEHHPEIEYKLGMAYLNGVHSKPPQPDVFRAEHYLSSAADNGHVDAMHALGMLNFRGQYGYRKNHIKAREYLKKAAEKGHRVAQYDYAWFCRYGIGGIKDISESIKYHEQAAIQGMILSRTELAMLYQEPECKDYCKAFMWADKAAQSGDRLGEYIMGNLFLLGRGCEADMDKAIMYYQKAYEKGMYQAKVMMEKIMRSGNNG